MRRAASTLSDLGIGRRLFEDAEYGPTNDDVVILGHEFWITRFGADPDVIGSTVRLDGEPNRIIGVLESGFEAPFDMEGIQMWKPPHFDPLDSEVRGWRGFSAVGRLGRSRAETCSPCSGCFGEFACEAKRFVHQRC
jgi:hypothetical protein